MHHLSLILTNLLILLGVRTRRQVSEDQHNRQMADDTEDSSNYSLPNIPPVFDSPRPRRRTPEQLNELGAAVRPQRGAGRGRGRGKARGKRATRPPGFLD